MKDAEDGSRMPEAPHRGSRAGTAPETAAAMVERALAEDRVSVAFQPVVDARAVSRVAFHEALMRIRTASDTLLPPGQFLPAVEDEALLSALDRRVLTLVLEQLARRPETRIAVNVSGATTRDPEWLALLRRAVERAPDVGFRLIVELNEQEAVWTSPSCGRYLHALREMGVSVALDDFGAGATGFSCFRDQRFDIVKIDGSFGDGLDRDRDAQALVRAMTDIARHFEMLTVIEFIASPADARRAMALGMDCMQGYLFGRPAARLEWPGDPDALSRIG